MRKRAQIDLQAFEAESHAGLVRAFAEHFMHARMRDESVQRTGRSGTGDEKIQIADGFLAPPHASRGADFFEALALGEIGHQLVRHAMAEIETISPRALFILRDGAQNFLFKLRAHARQIPQLLFPANAFQIVDAGHLEMLEQQRDALGTQPLDFQQLQAGDGERFEQFVADRERAPLDDVL